MLGLAIDDLPHVNAALNILTTVCLASGYYFIRNGMREKHKACMLSALFFSVLFMISYLTYHFNSGLAAFGGAGLIRPIYFSILILHVLGAVIITPMVPVTVYRALSGRFDAHRRLARWTFPLWMYVAVSGIVVYVMAIHLYPHAGGPYAGG